MKFRNPVFLFQSNGYANTLHQYVYISSVTHYKTTILFKIKKKHLLTRRRAGAVVMAIVDITRLNGDFAAFDLGFANVPELYSPSKFRLTADCFCCVVVVVACSTGTSNLVFFDVEATPNLMAQGKNI